MTIQAAQREYTRLGAKLARGGLSPEERKQAKKRRRELENLHGNLVRLKSTMFKSTFTGGGGAGKGKAPRGAVTSSRPIHVARRYYTLEKPPVAPGPAIVVVVLDPITREPIDHVRLSSRDDSALANAIEQSLQVMERQGAGEDELRTYEQWLANTLKAATRLLDRRIQG